MLKAVKAFLLLKYRGGLNLENGELVSIFCLPIFPIYVAVAATP